MSTTATAPGPGWYVDPAGAGLRYWDGQAWTGRHASRHDAPRPSARRAVHHAGVGAEPEAEAADRPRVPLGVALAATAGGVLALNLVEEVLSSTGAFGHVPRVVALVLALSLEPVCLLAPLVVWARRSRVSLAAATGFRFRRSDVPRGLGMGLVARVATVPAAALVVVISRRLLGTNTVGLDEVHGWLSATYIILAAVIMAPLVEEVAFRGALLPALTARLGPDWGLAATSVVFGSAHFIVALGLGNIGLVAILSVMGAILGSEARDRRTLGAGIIAHGVCNAVVVAVLLLR